MLNRLHLQALHGVIGRKKVRKARKGKEEEGRFVHAPLPEPPSRCHTNNWSIGDKRRLLLTSYPQPFSLLKSPTFTFSRVAQSHCRLSKKNKKAREEATRKQATRTGLGLLHALASVFAERLECETEGTRNLKSKIEDYRFLAGVMAPTCNTNFGKHLVLEEHPCGC